MYVHFIIRHYYLLANHADVSVLLMTRLCVCVCVSSRKNRKSTDEKVRSFVMNE